MSTDDDDSAKRRDALRAKRDRLYAEQAERTAQQRHAQDEARFQRYLGDPLQHAGIAYEVLWDDTHRRGPLTQYPIGFASVRWDRVPHAVSVQCGSDEDAKDAFGQALHALHIAPSTTVIVDWAIGGEPRLALSAADAATHALALIRHAADTWVYAEGATWLIEVYHEGSVTYAERPGDAEDAGDG